MPYVYSTQSCSVDYCSYIPSPPTANANQVKRKVTIKGGANIAPLREKQTSVVLMTPRGVATRVTDEELEFLESLDAFKRHRDRGFLKVDKSNKEKDIASVVVDMQKKDGSAPITPESKEFLRTATPVLNTPR